MSAEQDFALHPLAAQDITEIWDYIAADNPFAARRIREAIYSKIRSLVLLPIKVRGARISLHGLCASF